MQNWGGGGGAKKVGFWVLFKFEWQRIRRFSRVGGRVPAFSCSSLIFSLNPESKSQCIAAVSFIKNFVKFFPVALFQTNGLDIYKAVESAGTVSSNREQGFQSLIPWIFLGWSTSIFLKICVQLIAYSIVVRPGQVKTPGQTKVRISSYSK